MTKNNQTQKLPHSAVVEPTLNMLIANLMGEESRLYEMAEDRIRPEELDEYPMHARILEMMEYLDAEKRPPTAGNIKALLTAANEPEIAEFVDKVLDCQSVDLDVKFPAFAIKGIYLIKREALMIHQEFGELINSPRGLPHQQVQQITEKLQKVIERANNKRARHVNEVIQSYIDSTRERYDKAQRGEPVGPTWPWQNLRNLVPVIRRGNLVSLMGKSKWGKTTVGILCAEHWAWVQGYRVYLYAFETTGQEYAERQVANHTSVPAWLGTTGQWNLDDEDLPENRAFTEFIDTKLAGGLSGDILYQECAGWSMTMLKARILEHEKQAKRDGVECVHLIDYYQLIDTSEYRYENVPLNRIAQVLKTLASSEKLYLMTLVQEQEASDNGAFDNEFPKGGNEIVKVSQVFMRINRTYASNDQPVLNSEGVQALDSRGNERWYHRAGELDARMEIQVTHANADKKGSAKLLAEMAYFRIKDAPTT